MEDTKMLIKLVKDEADNIKKFATPEEIAKLELYDLNPNFTEKCIYGQMTGNCYSSRANKLIMQCATRVYESEQNYCVVWNSTLKGSPYPVEGRERSSKYHSPIERFIMCGIEGAAEHSANVLHNNGMLIDYIKGKRKSFKLRLD